MEALQKPDQTLDTTGPLAEEAGIFLTETYQLGMGAETPLLEVVQRIKRLDTTGRLVGITATPGEVRLIATPEKE